MDEDALELWIDINVVLRERAWLLKSGLHLEWNLKQLLQLWNLQYVDQNAWISALILCDSGYCIDDLFIFRDVTKFEFDNVRTSTVFNRFEIRRIL